MGLDRTTILREPGVIKYGGAYFYSKGPIEVAFVEERFAVPVDHMAGPVTERPHNRTISVKLTPAGEWENLSILFPHSALDAGESIFGGTDSALEIYTRAGNRLTLHNAAVFQEPAIRGTVKETTLGPMEFIGCLVNEADPTDTGAYYTEEASVTYPGDAAFAASAILTPAVLGTWGSGAFASFYTANGFTVTPRAVIEPEAVEGLGVIDYKLRSYEVTASAQPRGMTRAELLSELGFGSAFGASKTTNNLNIIGTGFYVRVYSAFIADPKLPFSAQANTIGDVMWKATRTISAGVPVPLLYVGTDAPA